MYSPSFFPLSHRDIGRTQQLVSTPHPFPVAGPLKKETQPDSMISITRVKGGR